MSRSYSVIGIALLFFVKGLLAASAKDTVVVSVPARAGAVDGKSENSDAFIWRLFTEFAAPADKSKSSPVVFETWASDEDTFSATPHWPVPGEPKKLHTSVLAAITGVQHSAIDAACNPPQGAATGGFPSGGSDKQCVAEEVKRNYPQYHYIVSNKLNTKAGLANAFKNSFKVAMPTDSISIKGDWVPVETMLQWLPELKNVENIRKHYYTALAPFTKPNTTLSTAVEVEFALVGLHVSSRQNPNWVWGTFEHYLNPGRCDSMGCFDSFGALTQDVLPNKTAVNTQYGACPKTSKLKELMSRSNLSPIWENYCLKSTQVDYIAPDGTPSVLGNSVIERIVGNGTVAASSCISCHVYASFGVNGEPTDSAKAMLPYNPTGEPIQGVLKGSQKFDFMWGVLNVE